MFRTSPPRGRAASLVLFAAVALIAVVAAPASAGGDVAVSASEQVTGRDPLILTVSGLREGVGLTVEVVDAQDASGTWRYPADVVANDQPLPVDLAAPDDGAAPRNGAVQINVTPDRGKSAETSSIVDRSPPAPALRTVVRDRRVGLTWDAITMPDPVTYRLERIAHGESWTVVQEGVSTDGYTDRSLDEGRYRYRLSAAVPSAEGQGLNWSALTADQVRITAPQPTPSPSPEDEQPATDDDPDGDAAAPAPAKATREPEARPTRQRPRSVAATGNVRGPVADDGHSGPQLQTRSTPVRGTAREPALEEGAVRRPAPPAVAAPRVAAPAPPTPRPGPSDVAAPPMEPFPVTVPPAGSLAVQAATQSPPDPVTLLTGAVLLLVAAGGVHQAQRRSGRPVIQGSDGHL